MSRPLYKVYRLHLIQGQNSVLVIKGSGERGQGAQKESIFLKTISYIFLGPVHGGTLSPFYLIKNVDDSHFSSLKSV